MKFETTPEQDASIRQWLSDHDYTCPKTSEGAIGGRLTFQFTPNALAETKKVVCACGSEFDFTDYSGW